LVIAVNQQDHCFGKIWIGQVPARDQQLADSRLLGILELDRKKSGRWQFAFHGDCVCPVRSTRLVGCLAAIPKQGVSGERRPEQGCAHTGYIKSLAVTIRPSGCRKGNNRGQHREAA
jgi:hypothetical protein